MIITLKELKEVCRQVASKDTCYPPEAVKWKKSNPLIGHCGSVAFTVHQLFGGEILSGQDDKKVRWIVNKLPNGDIICLVKPSQITKIKRLTATKLTSSRFYLFFDKVKKEIKQNDR